MLAAGASGHEARASGDPSGRGPGRLPRGAGERVPRGLQPSPSTTWAGSAAGGCGASPRATRPAARRRHRHRVRARRAAVHSLVDLRHLERVDGAGFEVCSASWRSTASAWPPSSCARRWCGPRGCSARWPRASTCSSCREHQVQVFDTVKQAARWLSPPEPESLAWLVKALDAQPAPDASAPAPALAGDEPCRAHPASRRSRAGRLAADLPAKAPRGGSSFQAELRRARVQHAQKLLLESS